jgi:hypothetical protein
MITNFKIFENSKMKLNSYHVLENLQLADKLYFKTGELTETEKQLILSITGGDNYTKIMADAFHHFKKFEPNGEFTSNSLSLKLMKKMYEYIKDYDENLFPIKDYDPNNMTNPKLHIIDLFEALKDRQDIISFVREYFDRIYLRNIREDIRKPRTRWEFVEIYNKMKTLSNQLSMLKRINPMYSDKIFKKVFSSKNKTIDAVLTQLTNIKEFLVNDVKPEEIKELVIDHCDSSKIVYYKNKIMIVRVGSNQDMVTLGKNTLWCFALELKEDGYWEEYALGKHVYIIIDFKKPVTNMYKFVVFLPAVGDFYDMYNDSINVNEYSSKIGIPHISELMWDLDEA